MKKIKLGVDCDGVLVDFVEPYCRVFNAVTGRNVSPDDMLYYCFSKSWGESEEFHLNLLDYVIDKTPLQRHLEPEKGAKEALNTLRQYFEIHLVTARKQSARENTTYSMNLHYPGVFTGHHYTGEYATAKDSKASKGALCNKESIDVLVDDSCAHVLSAIHAGVEGILLRKSWSEYSDDLFYSLPEEERNRFFVVDSWQGVVNHLMDRYLI